MKMLSFIIRPLAKLLTNRTCNKHSQGAEIQKYILSYLIGNCKYISFANDHHFELISDYESFKKQLPIQDYESIKKYIDRVRGGEENVLWKGKPIYFAKTSGTTSGSKYIPITKDSIGHHMSAARNSLFAYVAEKNDASFFSFKMIFLQGSPALEHENGISCGRLSGIVYHHVPAWLVSNRLPSYESNCIENWEDKVTAIVKETMDADMSLMSGIPPWCMMYFQKLLDTSGKENLKTMFPNLQVYVHGGVNYLPYKDKMKALLGEGVATIETYPASEGFFAYQDKQDQEGLLLNIDAGIFYEFVEPKDMHLPAPKRLFLGEVSLNVNYVLVVSTNAGLWAYNTGDTVKFVSLKPYRIVVTGRLKHFISAFGEHVIQEEVEKSIAQVAQQKKMKIVEFTVAPFVAPEAKMSYHEWFIEIEGEEYDLAAFAYELDLCMQEQNEYYADLRQGEMLQELKIRLVEPGGFKQYFERMGKIGGQNKVQHLSNDRNLVEEMMNYVKKG